MPRFTPNQITAGTAYASGDGRQRTVLGFSDSKARKGQRDTVLYRADTDHPNANPRSCLLVTFAKWAREIVSDVDEGEGAEVL